MRLIDVDAIYQDLLPYANRTRDFVMKIVNEQPTVEMAEDCISREAVYRQINKWVASGDSVLSLHKRVDALPSVQPQLKRGKWIFNENMHDYCCSECGCLMPNVNEYYRKKIIGCPYCLADMRDIRETGITAKEGMEIAKAFHDGIMEGFAEMEQQRRGDA